jgi:hypothetical protein
MFDVAVENRTPFEAATHLQMDQNGQEALLCVLSATFVGGTNGRLDLAPKQIPMCFADEPYGEAGRSSIKIEADIALVKPRVDLIVVGAAHAPGGRPASEVMVSLRVADIHKMLRVTGDRTAASRLLGGAIPFTRMPIVYERAFGGTTKDGDIYVENPVGVGFRGAASSDPSVATEVPNIEYPDRQPNGRGDHLPPAGFGVVARNWSPRFTLAGTYDQAWIDTVWPLPPSDFNPLFNQAAPLDQQTAALSGGEAVELINLTPSGLWRFRLPRLDVPVRLIFDDRVEDRAMRVDTVLIDAEQHSVTLKSRMVVTKVRNAPRLREIAMGHLSSAWLRARQLRKEYRDPRGGTGVLTERPTFQT